MFKNKFSLLAVSGLLLFAPNYLQAACSVDQVLELAKHGMSEDAIKAFCDKNEGSGENTTSDENVFSPETVLLEVKGKPSQEMLYTVPGNRTGFRALGYGGQASYSVFPGKAAKVRVDSSTPSFVIAIPEKIQPENYVSLVQLKLKRGDREMRTASGFYSLKTGLKKKVVVPIRLAEVKDHPKPAPKGYKLYRITPEKKLASRNEYALVVAVRQHSASIVGNFFGGFLNAPSSEWLGYDFGVK